MIKDLRKRLGQRILRLRMESGLTQEALAERLDLHGSYVGLLERGVKTPSLETLCRVADFFNLNLVDLLGEEGDEGGERLDETYAKRIVKLIQGIPEKDLDKIYRVLRIVFERK